MILAVTVIGIAVIACFLPVLQHLSRRWASDPDYSHGFIVPIISLYLLWHRRDLLPDRPLPSYVMSGLCFLAAMAVRGAAVILQYPLMEGASLLPCLAGVAFLIGGWSYIRWSWPSIVFLAFAIPLPGAIAGRMAGPLQTVATIGSTYTLQVLGIPAAATGNIILLPSGQVGVAEACNGLRMLIAFLAIAFAITVLLRIPIWERAFLLLSGVAVAIVCNIIRISATGVVYDLVSPELAEKIFHDFAGFVMMPLATGILALEIFLLARIFPVQVVDAAPILMDRPSFVTAPASGRVSGNERARTS